MLSDFGNTLHKSTSLEIIYNSKCIDQHIVGTLVHVEAPVQQIPTMETDALQNNIKEHAMEIHPFR